MGLNAVLKDRARVIERSPTPQKVEGRTQLAETHGPWFKVRLTPQEALETNGAGGLARTEVGPTLLVGQRDMEGNSLQAEDGGCVIKSKHRLRIVSRELGDSVWDVTGKPAPIRKRRRVIGWNLPIRQVDDEPFTPRLS